MLMGALLALPTLGLAQERSAANQSAGMHTPAAQTSPRAQGPATFDLKNAGVQEVVRATAAAAAENTDDGFRLARDTTRKQPVESDPTPAAKELKDIPVRAPRRPHHVGCDSFHCVAYTADGDALYTIPRERYYGVAGDNPQDEWLSCQSGDDLLTTFERYDKCRGVSIGLPLQIHDVVVNLPLVRL
jgi:hypothetical protein